MSDGRPPKPDSAGKRGPPQDEEDLGHEPEVLDDEDDGKSSELSSLGSNNAVVSGTLSTSRLESESDYLTLSVSVSETTEVALPRAPTPALIFGSLLDEPLAPLNVEQAPQPPTPPVGATDKSATDEPVVRAGPAPRRRMERESDVAATDDSNDDEIIELQVPPEVVEIEAQPLDDDGSDSGDDGGGDDGGGDDSGDDTGGDNDDDRQTYVVEAEPPDSQQSADADALATLPPVPSIRPLTEDPDARVSQEQPVATKTPSGFWLGSAIGFVVVLPALAGVLWLLTYVGLVNRPPSFERILALSAVFAGLPAVLTTGGVARLCTRAALFASRANVLSSVRTGALHFAPAGIGLLLLAAVPFGGLPDSPVAWGWLACAGAVLGIGLGAALGLLIGYATPPQPEPV